MVINYSEFLAATIDSKKFLTEERLWNLFKYLDVSNNNYLEEDDLEAIFLREGNNIDQN